jgi:FkbM family methyltransferase
MIDPARSPHARSPETSVPKPPLTALALAYSRRELPGWGRFLRLAGAYDQRFWESAGHKSVRGKWHGYLMDLDLSDHYERTAYFLARYHELVAQLFLRAVLRPGDTFVDVGAHAGMITLLGAGCVGPSGRVIAFEPNPSVFVALTRHIELNSLTHVRAENMGLSDTAGTLSLRILNQDAKLATCAPIAAADTTTVTQEHRIPVARGDDVIRVPAGTALTLKIDVEGFEHHVLRGLERTLHEHHPAIVTESIPWMYQRAGTTIHALFETMFAQGYRAYAIDAPRRHLTHRLQFQRLKAPEDLATTEVAWLHPQSPHMSRLGSWSLA